MSGSIKSLQSYQEKKHLGGRLYPISNKGLTLCLNQIKHYYSKGMLMDDTVGYRPGIYEGSAGSFQNMPEVFDEIASWKWGRPQRNYLRHWLPDDKKAKIVELARGGSKLLHFFERMGYGNILGVDISPEKVKLARQITPAVEEANTMPWVSLQTIHAAFGFGILLVLDVAVYRSQCKWMLLNGLLRSSNRVVLALSIVLASSAAMLAGFIFPSPAEILMRHTVWFALLLPPLFALYNLREATTRRLEQVIYAQLPGMTVRPGLIALGYHHLLYLSCPPQCPNDNGDQFWCKHGDPRTEYVLFTQVAPGGSQRSQVGMHASPLVENCPPDTGLWWWVDCVGADR